MGSKDQSQRGASAVEFAILAPIFVAVLFSVLEFGLILYTKSMLAHASREAARYGVVFCTPRRSESEIRAVVQDYLNHCGLTSTANVRVTGAAGASGADLDVLVTYTYQYFVLSKILSIAPFAGELPSSIDLQADTVMHME
jgi:Flp pilus assembly protein TadG